jgi:xylulokinase
LTDVVCCIDVGSTQTKIAFLDDQGGFLALEGAPTPGGSGGDPDQALDAKALLGTVHALIGKLTAAATGSRVQAICVTNQRATVLALDKADRVLAALSWQDPRAQDARTELAAQLDETAFGAITGLPHSTLWTLTKIRWLQQNRADLAAATCRYALVQDYLLTRLGADEAVIDPSNASPTGLWDLAGECWSPELLQLVRLDAAHLPRVVPAGTVAGTLGRASAEATGLPTTTSLIVGGGDQACAALGMGVLTPGQVGLSLGTAADILSLTSGIPEPRPGRISTAHVVAGQCLLEGFLGAFGASLSWVRRLLNTTADRPPNVCGLAISQDAPIFLPFLSGVATPDFNPEMRGALLGLAPSAGPGEIEAAVLDGLALELRRILESRVASPEVSELLVAGGAALHPGLRSRLADATQRPLVTCPTTETALTGAACIAWTALGRFPSLGAAANALVGEPPTHHSPQAPAAHVERRYAQYCRWVDALLTTTERP